MSMPQSDLHLDKVAKMSIGWQAIDRPALLIYADGFISGIGNRTVPFLRIVLPCGNVREYISREDVPMRSIRCNCGEVDYEHWFILYDKEDEDGS